MSFVLFSIDIRLSSFLGSWGLAFVDGGWLAGWLVGGRVCRLWNTPSVMCFSERVLLGERCAGGILRRQILVSILLVVGEGGFLGEGRREGGTSFGGPCTHGRTWGGGLSV